MPAPLSQPWPDWAEPDLASCGNVVVAMSPSVRTAVALSANGAVVGHPDDGFEAKGTECRQ